MTARTLFAGLVVVGGALLFSGCMENEMIAPEMLEDTENLELYFPERGEAWERRTPQEAGLDAALLEQAVDHALASDRDCAPDPLAVCRKANNPWSFTLYPEYDTE